MFRGAGRRLPATVVRQHEDCRAGRDAYAPGEHRFHAGFLDYSRHCGFAIRLCRPYRARTKGKVERFNGYLRRSFYVPLAARLKPAGVAVDAATANREALRWLREVASMRVHATTQARPAGRLAEEQAALQPLPPSWRGDIKAARPAPAAAEPPPACEAVEKGRGRIEIRRHILGGGLDWLAQKADWAGLSALGRAGSTRIIGGKTTTEHRCYLCSFADLGRFAEAVRGHWAIENSQHWVLDVRFGEDANRAREGHSAKNLAAIRRMSLNVIRHNDPDSTKSLRRRKRLASLNDDYRSSLIFGEPGA